jgi:hypothetical protein
MHSTCFESEEIDFSVEASLDVITASRTLDPEPKHGVGAWYYGDSVNVFPKKRSLGAFCESWADVDEVSSSVISVSNKAPFKANADSEDVPFAIVNVIFQGYNSS